MSDQAPAVTVLGLEDETAIWKYLHDLFRAPGEAQWRWLAEERTRRAFTLLATGLGMATVELPLPPSFIEYEQDYLASFEVGLPHPPAPLCESHWKRSEPTPRVLHQNLLFYRRFGLELRQPCAESVDHLRHQLELMVHLCRLELGARRDGKESEVEQLTRARREFAEQHLVDWVPLAVAALEGAAPGSWPLSWLTFLERCCQAACDATTSEEAPGE